MLFFPYERVRQYLFVRFLFQGGLFFILVIKLR